MYKVSIVGIDNCGKTSIVNYLSKIDKVDTIHLTSCRNNDSSLARLIVRPLNRVVDFSERHNLKSITGGAYLSYLVPYALEERSKSNSVLVSDRDPIIDTLTYASVYLPDSAESFIRDSLRKMLEHSFKYPDAVIYLNVSPEVSVQRNGSHIQIHEEVDSLSKLKNSIEIELDRLSHLNMEIHCFDTTIQSLDDVKFAVKLKLTELIEKNCPYFSVL